MLLVLTGQSGGRPPLGSGRHVQEGTATIHPHTLSAPVFRGPMILEEGLHRASFPAHRWREGLTRAPHQ